jgi:hypothetical protein
MWKGDSPWKIYQNYKRKIATAAPITETNPGTTAAAAPMATEDVGVVDGEEVLEVETTGFEAAGVVVLDADLVLLPAPETGLEATMVTAVVI